MPNFSYTAKDIHGKNIQGTMFADSEKDLHDKLKEEEQFLVSAKEKSSVKKRKKIKSDDLSEFARNIGQLVGAGVSLVKALGIVAEDESISPKLRIIYEDVLKLVRTGVALSDALEEQGQAFPPLFINMMRSAEASGNLERISEQMSNYYSKEYRLNGKVKSAMLYPKILSVLLVVVVAIIMGFVMPQFKDLFDKMDTLPISTEVLLAISSFVKNKWYLIAFFAIVVTAVFYLLMTIPVVRYYRDKLKIKAPVFGQLMRVIYTARFARTLSSLYSAGISILNALQIARTTIDNSYIEKQFDEVITQIKAGINLSAAIDEVDGFTKKLSSTIMVGEETGALDRMLVSVADQMEYDSDLAINKLVSYLEPVMIIIMAVVVGFIMIAVIQPIYGSYQSISNSYE